MISYEQYLEATRIKKNDPLLSEALEKITAIFQEIKNHCATQIPQQVAAPVVPQSYSARMAQEKKAQTDFEQSIKDTIKAYTDHGVKPGPAKIQAVNNALKKAGSDLMYMDAKEKIQNGSAANDPILRKFQPWMFESKINEELQPDFFDQKENEVKMIVNHLYVANTKMVKQNMQDVMSSAKPDIINPIKDKDTVAYNISQLAMPLHLKGLSIYGSTKSGSIKDSGDSYAKNYSRIFKLVSTDESGNDTVDRENVEKLVDELAQARSRIVQIRNKNGKVIVQKLDLESEQQVSKLIQSLHS